MLCYCGDTVVFTVASTVAFCGWICSASSVVGFTGGPYRGLHGAEVLHDCRMCASISPGGATTSSGHKSPLSLQVPTFTRMAHVVSSGVGVT